MSDSDTYRRRAEALLRKAAETANMRERSELIDQAMHWHMLAMDARESHDRTNDNTDAKPDDREARG
jgi:hypothetical protein